MKKAALLYLILQRMTHLSETSNSVIEAIKHLKGIHSRICCNSIHGLAELIVT